MYLATCPLIFLLTHAYFMKETVYYITSLPQPYNEEAYNEEVYNEPPNNESGNMLFNFPCFVMSL